MIYFVLLIEFIPTPMLFLLTGATLFIIMIIIIILVFVELLKLVEDHGAEGEWVKDVCEVVVRERVVDWEIQQRDEAVLLETVLPVGLIETQGAAQQEEESS